MPKNGLPKTNGLPQICWHNPKYVFRIFKIHTPAYLITKINFELFLQNICFHLLKCSEILLNEQFQFNGNFTNIPEDSTNLQKLHFPKNIIFDKIPSCTACTCFKNESYFKFLRVSFRIFLSCF